MFTYELIVNTVSRILSRELRRNVPTMVATDALNVAKSTPNMTNITKSGTMFVQASIPCPP